MANAYGIVHQYGEPQSTFDADLAANVLGQKQQQFDANQQKIDQTLAQMGLSASMLKNDGAKEYINDRVNQVIEQTRGMRTSDIGSQATTRKLISTINSALDDKTIKHIGYGQQIEKFQASVAAAQEDGKYADMNYQDAAITAGLQEYMQGDVNSELGSLKYTPYNDNAMGLMKKVKEIKSTMGEEYEDILTADGVVERVKIKNLTDSEWRQVLPKYIDPQMKAQMEIEGRAMFGWSKENVIKYSEKAIDERINPLKKKIERNKNLLNTEGEYSEAKKKKLIGEIATNQKMVDALENKKLEQDYDMTSLGSALVMEDLINTTAAIVGNNPSIERKYDKNSRQAISNNALLDSEGQGIVMSDTTTDKLEEVTEQTRLRRQNESKQEYLQDINNAFKTLPEELRIEAEELAETYREEDSELSVEDSRYMAFDKKVAKAKSVEALEAHHKLQSSKIKYGKQVKSNTESYKKVVAQELWQEEKIYKSVIEEGVFDQTKIVLDDGSSIHSKDYLERQGVNSYEDWLKFLDKPESSEFKGQVLANYALSDTNRDIRGISSSLGEALGEGGTATRFSREDYHNLKSLMAVYGEEMDITDLLVFNKKDVTLNEIINITSGLEAFQETPMGVSEETLPESHIIKHLGDGIERMKISLNPEAKHTKTYKALEKTLKAKNYRDKPVFLSNLTSNIVDDSFYSDKTIRDTFKRSNVIDRIEKERNAQDVLINTPKKITLQAAKTDGKASNEIMAVQSLAASRDTTGNFKLERNLPVEIRINPSDPGQVVIEQMKEYSKADYNKKIVNTLRGENIAIVDISQFAQQLPELYARLDLNEQTGSINYLSDMDEEREGIAYLQENDRESAEAYTKFFQGNTKLANSATKDASLDMLESILPEETRDVYSLGFRKAIENSDKFSVSLKTKGDKKYIKIFSTEGENKTLLNSIDMSSKPTEELLRTFNAAPQVFLTQYFETIAQDIAFNSVNNEGRMSNRFKGFWELIEKL